MRFSHWVVPVGYVPSTGKALTGRLSPSPAIIVPRTFANELGGFVWHSLARMDVLVSCCRHLDFVQVFQGLVNRLEVALHNGLAALAIGLFNGVFDLVNRLLLWQYTADGEEAGLHDGVDAPAHAGLLRHFVSIDHVKAQFLCP